MQPIAQSSQKAPEGPSNSIPYYGYIPADPYSPVNARPSQRGQLQHTSWYQYQPRISTPPQSRAPSRCISPPPDGHNTDPFAQLREDPAQTPGPVRQPTPGPSTRPGPGTHVSVPVSMPAIPAVPDDLFTPVEPPQDGTWWFEEYINDLPYSPTCDIDKIAEFDAYAKWLVIIYGTWEWDPRVGMYWEPEFNAMWPPISVEEWITRMVPRQMPPKTSRTSRGGRRKAEETSSSSQK
ncbi:hypothetical protein CC1G_04722 [Coprinopsis cinerea okayama7|uniref:Uncharacterized protein n=1 Tax=Coprinopsis cinerea (strain Okayama-7 / 130 / ATCC MYA-4618 / FGSC 9003) TaxID=240176 RepID=A8P2B5_COPC7|nr:hypothetical protein CC1G_04722 [Coprinopsis cinerea okayama7\|eukprot:XP_001838278.2 hypothetical protein CC1G_04722 [Coprinopsis cinerea okayama7\